MANRFMKNYKAFVYRRDSTAVFQMLFEGDWRLGLRKRDL